MWFCPECGSENESTSNFCFECGTSKPNDLDSESEVKLSASQDSNSEKKKMPIWGKVLVAILAILVIYKGFGLIKNYLIAKDPVKRIAYGYSKMLDAKTLELNSKTSLNLTRYPDEPETKIFFKMLEDLEIEIDGKRDKKANRILETVKLNMDKDSIVDAVFYADKESAGISIPLLIDEWVYINYEDLDDMIDEMSYGEVSQFSAEDYLPLFDFDDVDNWSKIQKEYIDFLSNNLDEYIEEGDEKVVVIIENAHREEKVKCDEVIITMDINDLFNITEDIIEKIQDDERVKEALKQKIEQFFEIAESNGDLDEMDLDKDDIGDILEDFDDNYEDLIDEMLDDLDEAKQEIREETDEFDLELEWSFRFDSRNRIRNIVTKVGFDYTDYYDSIGAELENNLVIKSMNEKLDFEKPDFSDGYNFSDDPEETLEELEAEFQYNFMKNLFSNQEFYKLFETFGY